MAGFATGHPSAVTSFVIGGAAALTAAGQNFDPTTLNNKEIAVLGVEGNGSYTKIADGNGANYSEVIIAYKDNNGELHFTPKIPNTAEVRFNSYKAATEQVTHIGWNGTVGSGIPAVDDTIFQIKAVVRTTIVSSIDGQSHPTFEGFYKSDASATEEEIANGLYVSFRGATSKKRNAHYFDVDRVAALDGDEDITTAITTLTFKKDSKVVQCGGDIDGAGGGETALTPGSYIRVGILANSSVYKIAVVDTTNNALVLDAPYVGETITLLDDGVAQFTAANAAGLEWGIKVTGVKQPWRLDRKNFEQISFELLGGVIPVTKVTSANRGSGIYEEVSQLEYFHVASDGSRDHIKEPPNEFPRDLLADSSIGGYDLCTMSWTSESVSGIGKGALRKAVIMVIPTDRTEALYGATAGDTVNNVLEEFFSSITSIDANGTLVTDADAKMSGTITA